MRKPYLIQRGRINRPLTPEFTRLSDAVSLDYMGSSEFEFGALPKSFRAIAAANAEVSPVTTLVKEIRENVHPLRVLFPSSMSSAEREEYLGYINELRYANPRLKEVSRFQHDYPSRGADWDLTDFWWDIENHVMWSFDKNFMNRLYTYLLGSFEVMGLNTNYLIARA